METFLPGLMTHTCNSSIIGRQSRDQGQPSYTVRLSQEKKKTKSSLTWWHMLLSTWETETGRWTSVNSRPIYVHTEFQASQGCIPCLRGVEQVKSSDFHSTLYAVTVGKGRKEIEFVPFSEYSFKWEGRCASTNFPNCIFVDSQGQQNYRTVRVACGGGGGGGSDGGSDGDWWWWSRWWW